MFIHRNFFMPSDIDKQGWDKEYSNIDVKKESRILDEEDKAGKYIEPLVKDVSADMPEAKFIDIGCGVGRHTYRLAKYFKQAYGFDISYNVIRAASGEYKNVNFFAGDVLNIGVKSDTFDFVFMSGVLYDFYKKEDHLKCLSEISRILKSGGILFFYHRANWNFFFVSQAIIRYPLEIIKNILIAIKRVIVNKEKISRFLTCSHYNVYFTDSDILKYAKQSNFQCLYKTKYGIAENWELWNPLFFKNKYFEEVRLGRGRNEDVVRDNLNWLGKKIINILYKYSPDDLYRCSVYIFKKG